MGSNVRQGSVPAPATLLVLLSRLGLWHNFCGATPTGPPRGPSRDCSDSQGDPMSLTYDPDRDHWYRRRPLWVGPIGGWLSRLVDWVHSWRG